MSDQRNVRQTAVCRPHEASSLFSLGSERRRRTETRSESVIHQLNPSFVRRWWRRRPLPVSLCSRDVSTVKRIKLHRSRWVMMNWRQQQNKKPERFGSVWHSTNQHRLFSLLTGGTIFISMATESRPHAWALKPDKHPAGTSDTSLCSGCSPAGVNHSFVF